MNLSRRSAVGFTLVEMLVVIAIMGVLAAIIVPVTMAARKKAQQVQCINNQRQLALSLMIYAQDHDVFPSSRDWYAAIDLKDPRALTCPSDTRESPRVGFGMNAFLNGLKLETIKRPHMLICTCDSEESATITPDFSRHGKNAVFSRVDGSVVSVPKVEEAGRFAAGRFPLRLVIIKDDKEVQNPPIKGFKSYAASTPIANEFLFAGPYGGDPDSIATATELDLLDIDYINEAAFARLTADDVPMPGEIAPEVASIWPHQDGSDGHLEHDPTSSTKPDHAANGPAQFVDRWRFPTPNIWNTQAVVRLEIPEHYNCQFTKRTTYGVIFIYSDKEYLAEGADGVYGTADDTTVEALIDDLGNIYMNGQLVLTDDKALDNTTEVNRVAVTIPQGISYFLFRVSNWTEGGAKFNLKINRPVSASGTI